MNRGPPWRGNLSPEGRGTVLVVDWARKIDRCRRATVLIHLAHATGRASMTGTSTRAPDLGPGALGGIIPFKTLLDEMDEPFQPEFPLHRTHVKNP